MKIIGFIGTGLIGNPMARRLLQTGFLLLAYDKNPRALESVIAAGAKPLDSLAGLKAAEAIIVMVNNMAQVNEVVLGQGGIVESLGQEPIPLLVIMSTVSPEDVQGLSAQLVSYRVRLLEAPVSGGPFLAEQGRLAIMAGGLKDDFDRVRPVFEALGDKLFHVGPLGSGMAMKLVNNMIALASMLTVSEALGLGVKHGLEVDRMVEVINAGSGKTFVTENWPLIKLFLQTALQEEDPFGARGALFTTGRKDMVTAKQWAEGKGHDTPVLDRLLESFSSLDEATFVAGIRKVLG